MPRPVCVVVEYVFPPVPIRSWDWMAYVDGREERGPYGQGATRQEAVDDLLERIEEEDD